jgi:hypothetical protein
VERVRGKKGGRKKGLANDLKPPLCSKKHQMASICSPLALTYVGTDFRAFGNDPSSPFFVSRQLLMFDPHQPSYQIGAEGQASTAKGGLHVCRI